MLPQIPPDNTVTTNNVTARTIYINPNFNKAIKTMTQCTATVKPSPATLAHINPLFLQGHHAVAATQTKQPLAIHMNPNFLQRQLLVRQQELLQQEKQQQQLQTNVPLPETVKPTCPPLPQNPAHAANSCKIISKSRMQIVRAPSSLQQKTTVVKVVSPTQPPVQQPIIRLSQRKLVRRTNPTSVIAHNIAATTAPKVSKSTPKESVTTNTSSSSAASVGRYKIDNRHPLPRTLLGPTPLRKMIRRRPSFVARYALRRASAQASTASASLLSKQKSVGSGATGTLHRKLQLLNINGVLYKSTHNKLQRKDVATTMLTRTAVALKPKPKASTAPIIGGRTLFVRGTKYIMDAAGFHLTRITATSTSSGATSSFPTSPLRLPSSADVRKKPHLRQRIDIGGLTYVASAATQNVFVRTRNHEALAHLNSAKQRSLQLLMRARLVKSNIPCAIFKRVGRCAAYERGRCNKVHDKLQVIICPRFLRGECDNANCLLSHNVSLSKMPVCRFFLQGVCVRSDCPYLHKKLSQKADVCENFLRGFCRLADQCEKRHEFVCLEIERNGKCKTVNCSYCKSKKRPAAKQGIQKQQTAAKKLRKEDGSSRLVPTSTPSTQKNDVEPENAKSTPAVRYFSGSRSSDENMIKAKACENYNAETSVEVSSSDCHDTIMSAPPTVRMSRPKVGTLPAFIPLS